MNFDVFKENFEFEKELKDICFADSLDYDESLKHIYENVYCNSKFLYIEFESIVNELKSNLYAIRNNKIIEFSKKDIISRTRAGAYRVKINNKEEIFSAIKVYDNSKSARNVVNHKKQSEKEIEKEIEKIKKLQEKIFNEFDVKISILSVINSKQLQKIYDEFKRECL